MARNQDTKSFNKPLPNSPETERAVLGMLLIEPVAIYEVNTLLKPETFYSPHHGTIYQAIEMQADKGESPDMVSVVRTLMQLGKLDEVGGAFTIAELASCVASTTNLVEHACYLHQLHLARNLAVAAQVMQVQAVDPTRDIEEVIGESFSLLESVSEQMTFNANTLDLNALTREALTLYTERENMARQGKRTGIATGLQKLDKATGGWQPGDLILNAARPAMGKTALMLHIARAAAREGTPVVIFSLEMNKQSLTNRLLVSESGIEADRFKNGYLSNTEHPLLESAASRLSALPILIDDTANISMPQIKARCAHLARRGKCGFVCIDYLQLIDMRCQNQSYNREQEVAQCTRAAKMMAKELKIPVMLLSQLSRKAEERSDKTPILPDLRESGAIEQDADIVLFIHRPEYYAEYNARKGEGKLRIAKQRNGPTGDIWFGYNESLTQFTDLT